MAHASYAKKIEPLTLMSSPGAQIARAECAQCSAHTDWRVAKLPPPDILRRHFTERGWRLDRRTQCPACAARKKERPMATVTTIKPNAVSAAPAPSGPTPDAKAARREAHDRIAIFYDLASGRYKDGYSDQRIAEETGVAVAWVKSRREEEFGPLKEPEEIRELREELAALDFQQNNLLARFKDINARLDAFCKANGFAS